MLGIINFFLGYVFLLIAWLIVNVIFYCLTLVFKKGFFNIPLSINMLINWGISLYFIIYPLYFLWQIIIAKEWLILIVVIILGSFIIGFWQSVMEFLVAPFSIITMHFSNAAVKVLETKIEESGYEVISPKGKVIEKHESDDEINRNLAKWFLLGYGMLFFYQFINMSKNNWLGLGWHVLLPLLVLILSMIPLSVLTGIWNLIKKRPFLGKGIKVFLTNNFKIFDWIYGILLAFQLIDWLLLQ